MLSEGVGGLKEQMSGLVDISGVQEGTSAFKEDTLHDWVLGAWSWGFFKWSSDTKVCINLAWALCLFNWRGFSFSIVYNRMDCVALTRRSQRPRHTFGAFLIIALLIIIFVTVSSYSSITKHLVFNLYLPYLPHGKKSELN